MWHFKLDGFFLVRTENDEERERFQRALAHIEENVAPQPTVDPNLQPAPNPADPFVPPVSPTPEPEPPVPPPDPPPPIPTDPEGTPVAISALTPSSLTAGENTSHNFTVSINAVQSVPTVVTLVSSAPSVLRAQV